MRIFCLFLFASAVSPSLHAQWTKVGSAFPTTVRGLYFQDADTGYAVGGDNAYAGYFSKTTDGGVTWNYMSTTESFLLRAVDFAGNDTGFVCGSGGKLFRTTDAGSTWTLIYTNAAQYFRSVDFISTATGFLGGAAGTIHKTTDGGFSFITYNLSQATSDVIQLHMVDSLNGYAVCSTPLFDQGYVYKTTDGGASWVQVYYDAGHGFLGLAVVNEMTVYAGGKNQMIIKSIDGGSVWDTVYTGLTGYSIRAAFPVSDNRIFMVDDGANGILPGQVLSTYNAGTAWQDTSFGQAFFSVYFPVTTIGYTADLSGNVYRIELPCPGLTSADSISGPASVCANDTAVYSVDVIADAVTYTWNVPTDAVITGGNGSTSVIVAFGTTSGNISVNAFNECDTVTISLPVTVDSLPPIPTITFFNDTLVASADSGYQWYFNDVAIPGATNQTYDPEQNGVYSVTVTNASGCSSISAPFDVFGLDIFETALSSGIVVFPNPLINTSAILLTENRAEQFLIITDIYGKIIREIRVQVPGRMIMIDKKDMQEGLYFLSLHNENHQFIAGIKLVVE